MKFFTASAKGCGTALQRQKAHWCKSQCVPTWHCQVTESYP